MMRSRDRRNSARVVLWRLVTFPIRSSRGNCATAKSWLQRLHKRQLKRKNGCCPAKLVGWKQKAWNAHGASHRCGHAPFYISRQAWRCSAPPGALKPLKEMSQHASTAHA